MSSKNTKIIQWKKVYQLIAGTFYRENVEVVKKRLLDIHQEILDGLKIFKKPKSDANEEVEKLLKDKQQERLISFAQKLYKFLDLDVAQTYELLCFYLVNEYRGSAASLQNFVSNESLMIKLLNDIWFYYSLERMVHLKTVKCVIEYHESSNHPYQAAYKALIEKIGMGNIRKSFIDQFELILKDVHHSKYLAGDIFNSQQKLQSWSERKHRELNEILQIILITTYYDKMLPEELQKLLELFKLHSFGKQNQFLSASNALHIDLIQRVNHSEISVLMVALSSNNVDKDIAWTNEVIEKLDEKIISMHHYTEHGPILLTWMIYKFASKSHDTSVNENLDNYGKLGARAVQLNVFDYLYKMLNHKQFKDKSLSSRIVTRCIYDNLVFLCKLFNEGVSNHPKVFELFSKLLLTPAIAKDFCKNEDNPIRALFNSAVEIFPVNFIQLSIMGESLAKASKTSSNWIVDFLQNLPVYTEQPNDPAYELRKSEEDQEDSYMLLNDYQPFKKIPDFIIRVNNTAIVREDKGKMFVHFLTKLNYFHALHNEINELLNCVVSFAEIQDTQLKRLECGINLLGAVVKQIENPDDISNEMIHPTEMVFDILEKFKVFQHPSLDLMSACLNVCAELVTFFGEEIIRRFLNLNIAPTVNMIHNDYQAYCNGNGFESGIVGYYLINIERSTGRYNFTKAYFHFLKNCVKLEIGDINSVELPGLLFIMREVFNSAHTWYYENEQDRMEILLFAFEFIHNILTIPHEVIKDDRNKKMLRDICVYSLLYLDNGASLLRYIAIGNPGLNNFMENESNWFLATESDLNIIVLNAMRILMQTLRLKETITGNDVLTPLEQMIYTQPKQRDTLKIIPIVANYTTYSFNLRFPVLSCRLLRRFAIEFQSSLSACLDLEPDQIRMMFLQRLRDDLESEDLKVSILDFVNACIDKQPGLTEAFFKVSYEKDAKSSFFIKKTSEEESICDGIISYMEEFLEAVSKDPAKITNDQLKRIMNLFHGLWKQGLQSLVSSLLKKTTFWPSLCSPILTVPIENYQYSQLLNIIGIELFKLRESNSENESFRKVVEKFLSPDIFKKWLSVVFELPNLSVLDVSCVEETPEWLSRLQSFKDFLVLLLKKKSIIKIPSGCKNMLLDQALLTLLHLSEEMENGSDSRPFIVIAELYMMALHDQDLKFTKNHQEDAELLEQIQRLLKTVTNCYGSLHKRAKEAVLAITIKILELESDEIKNHPAIANNFVISSLEILSNEFFVLENQSIDDDKSKTRQTSTILSINLLKRILLIGKEFYGNCSYWFNYYKIFNRILSIVAKIAQKSNYNKITVELFDLLLIMAEGSYSKNLLHCDVGDYLWMNMITPASLTDRFGNLIDTNKDDWSAPDWWVIYTKGIQLVKVLLEKERHLFIREALFFVGIHEQYLSEAVALAKYSLEPNALMLIKSTLELVSEVVKYENIWSADYQLTMQNIIKYVQCLLDHAVSLLYRPKLLKRLTEASKPHIEEYSDEILSDPSEDFIDATNGLIEIISLCCQCLLHFSPKLMSLLCDVEFHQSKWIPFIDVQFGAPKINSSGSPQLLSYGSILSIVALLVKTLNLQHFAFKQVPLNNIPQEQADQGNQTVTMLTVVDSSTPQMQLPTSPSPSKNKRPFSKSLSMSSMTSSVIQPSNELLLHIDSKICLAALEFLLTLLASQSLLSMRARQLSNREKQMIRRELSTELHCFHDFVKKKILKDTSKSPLYRQKMGKYQIFNDVDNADDNLPGSSRSSTLQRRSQDLRVNVVRKLHLSQQKPTPFEIPATFSPIQGSIQSTPSQVSLNPTTSTQQVKRVGFDLNSTQYSKISVQEYDDEPFVINSGDPSFTGLSLVKFIEEDYLQLLSNIFLLICQNEN